MIDWVHPGAVMILGALLIPFFKGTLRKAYLLVLPLIAFGCIYSMEVGTYGVFTVLGEEVTFGRVDKLSLVFGYIFTIAAFIWMVYGLGEERSAHNVSAYVYAGGALGVTFAGDYIALFLFWEMMAFSSVFLILMRNTEEAGKSAYRYILVHAFSGICLLGGMVIQFGETQSFAFVPMELDGIAAGLILIAFLINAAVPPFGAWLPDAYPQATVTGAIFMTSFTTKSAVYALIRGFPGTELLIWLGVFMAVYGVVYAVLENDIRRLLAYHIVSQVGYMVAAVGIGTELALNGAAAHAFAHILYKGLLFMGAGSVLYMTGKSKLTELGGVYKTMPWTFILYMIGGFAISSVPLFSGFVSKSLITSAAAGEHLTYAWLFLTLASSGTFLHTGLKLPYFTFMAEDRKLEAKDPPTHMLVGMSMAAFLCIFIGIKPSILYQLLPYAVDYHPYTADHVVWTWQILLLTWLGFYIYIKKLGGEATVSMDTDWFYRMGGRVFMAFSNKVIAAADDVVSNAYRTVLLKLTVKSASGSLNMDKTIIDGAVNGVANIVARAAERLRTVQTGQLQHYGLAILIGLFLLLNLLFFFPVDQGGQLVPRALIGLFR